MRSRKYVTGLEFNESMSDIIQDFEGNYWMTSYRKGLMLLSRSKFQNGSMKYGLDETIVNCITEYCGKLYIGTDDGLRIINADGTLDRDSDLPSQMSGGQKQRLAAARALILNPGIILADEPTGALDSRNAKALMEKLAGLNRDEKATVLMVTHDSNAASYCKRILFIQDGVIFHELRRDLLAETQQQFYERILQVMAQLGGGSANVL